ncbi:MoaD/ThiS family protein [Thermaerobacter litoralis]
MQIRVRLGPDLARAAGVPAAVVETPDEVRVDELLERLAQTYPALREALSTALLVAGGRVLGRQDPVPPDADLALLQPMAGGGGAASEEGGSA